MRMKPAVLATLLALFWLGPAAAQTTPWETFMFGRAAPAIPYASSLCIAAAPSGTANSAVCLPGTVITQDVEFGWIPAITVDNVPFLSALPFPIQITSIGASIAAAVAVGGGDTLQINALGPQARTCSGGSNMATGTVNADGGPALNPQTLTLAANVTLQTGSILCAHAAGSNWGSGSAGSGGVSVHYMPLTTPVTNCTIGGSTVGTSSTQSCTQVTYAVTGDSGAAVWTVSGGHINRNGVADTGISAGVTILLLLGGNLYQYNGNAGSGISWYQWNNPPTWGASTTYTNITNDPR